MPLPIRRALATACLALRFAALAHAQTPATDRPARVRPVAQDVRALLDALVARSSTGRSLVDRLERSDVIVYVRSVPFTTQQFDGRTGLLASGGRHRFLVVEIACVRLQVVQLTTLAHELYHALEIAESPDIVDAPTLAAHYSRIGIRVGGGLDAMYETEAAARVGRRVHLELVGAGGRIAPGL